MSTTSEEIPQLLQNLRLYKMAATLESELAAARKSSPSYSDFLARLLRAEWLDQQQRKLQARIQRAAFPEIWTLESFPFKQQPGVSRRQIQELAELEFIPKATNIVFIGPVGVGKTGLASGLLLKALQNGYRARFIKAQDLFDEMYAFAAVDGLLKFLPQGQPRATAIRRQTGRTPCIPFCFSWMAMWVMDVLGAAPCQCFSPAAIQTTSPGRISSIGPPQRCMRPTPAVTISVWPKGCVCQFVRAPGSKVTLPPVPRAGSGA